MWRDEHTGLYHTHYRLYDPQHVRWLTPDPAGYRDGQNLYRFYAGPNGVDVLGDDEVNIKPEVIKDKDGKIRLKFSVYWTDKPALWIGSSATPLYLGEYDLSTDLVNWHKGGITTLEEIENESSGSTNWEKFEKKNVFVDTGTHVIDTCSLKNGLMQYQTLLNEYNPDVAKRDLTKEQFSKINNGLNLSAELTEFLMWHYATLGLSATSGSSAINGLKVAKNSSALLSRITHGEMISAYREMAILRINDLRIANKCISGTKFNINVATSDSFINGQYLNLVANSGSSKLFPNSIEFAKDAKSLFNPKVVGGYLRDTDSEKKILEYLGAALKNVKDPKGVVYIHSERIPCISCSDVAEAFQKLYPNVKVIMTGYKP